MCKDVFTKCVNTDFQEESEDVSLCKDIFITIHQKLIIWCKLRERQTLQEEYFCVL